jgi:hypothetical protein
MKATSPIALTAILLAVGLLRSAVDLAGAEDDLGSAQGATITGTVVDARTMQPLRGAIVSAACVPGTRADPPARIGFRTGPDGKFVLRGVAPGVVSFLVVKAGYVSGPFVSVRPAVGGEQIDNVVLAIPPGAALGGRVLDETGQPVANVMVTVRTTGIVPRGTPLPLSAGAVGYSDNDGKYWAGGLAAGEYAVNIGGVADTTRIVSFGGVTMISGSLTTNEPLVRPAEPLPVAQMQVALSAGEERTNADIVVRFDDRVAGSRLLDGGTATVAGRVVDSSGAPIAHALVVLRHPAMKATVTRRADAEGNFSFENIHAGAVSVGIVQRGTIETIGEAARPTTLQIETGKRTENVTLIGTRGGTISGALTDEYGDPVAATVMAMPPAGLSMSGVVASNINLGVATADARGRYQISDLIPGEYVISVVTGQPARGRTEVHFTDPAGQDRLVTEGRVFYPGVSTMSQASTVRVTEGRGPSAIDLVLRPVMVSSIDLTVTTNRPVNEIQVYQIMLDERFSMIERSLKLTGRSATLEAQPGRYRLLASAEVASNADTVTRLWSSVDVETDPLMPATVNMTLEPGANVAGRISFEGKELNRQNAVVSLVPIEALPSVNISTMDGNSTLSPATGEFSIAGILPGRWIIQVGNPSSPWMLKAASVRGRDVLDEPVTLAAGEDLDEVLLTVTDRVNEVSGKVVDATGRPTRSQWVVVFAADKRYWWPGSRRVRAVRPNADGRYVARGLPPGTYLVALLPDVTTEYELIGKLPSLVPSGIRITIAEGDKKEQDLRSGK